MPRTKSHITFKRDNLLVEFIREHKGRSQAVSSKEIAKYLSSKGYETTPWAVNTCVKHVMYDRHLPICFVNAKGYYWSVSKDEIQKTIADLSGRIEELQRHIDHLNSFIIN